MGGETGNGWGQLRNGALVTGARNDQGEKTTDTFFFGGGMEEETCHLRCCFGDQNIGGLYIFFSILHFVVDTHILFRKITDFQSLKPGICQPLNDVFIQNNQWFVW